MTEEIPISSATQKRLDSLAKRCPWCASRNLVLIVSGVVCRDCGCHGPESTGLSVRQQINDWNNRNEMDEL